MHGEEPFGVQLDLRVHVSSGETERGLTDLRHAHEVRGWDVAGDEHHLAPEPSVDDGGDVALARGVGHLVQAAQLEHVDEVGAVVHRGRAPPGRPDRHLVNLRCGLSQWETSKSGACRVLAGVTRGWCSFGTTLVSPRAVRSRRAMWCEAESATVL